VTAAPPLVVVLGPTASGKTRLSLPLAEALASEIVSADSVQIHRRLDIGSAKPSAAERARVPHHGLDVLEPTEPSHAGRWLEAVTPAIARLHAAGRVPLVVGGTGLYARALLLGLSAVPEVDAALRERVRRAALADPGAAWAELARLDPPTAARLAPADVQRVARALEVAHGTGRPLSAWHADDPPAPRYAATIIVLEPEATALQARIAARAAAMLADGLHEEVAALLAAGVPADAPGLRTLGYREVTQALAAGRRVGADELARAHWQYARRQRTWLRGSGMAGLTTRRLDPDAPGAERLVLALARASA